MMGLQGDCRALLDKSQLAANYAENGGAFFAASSDCFVVGCSQHPPNCNVPCALHLHDDTSNLPVPFFHIILTEYYQVGDIGFRCSRLYEPPSAEEEACIGCRVFSCGLGTLSRILV